MSRSSHSLSLVLVCVVAVQCLLGCSQASTPPATAVPSGKSAQAPAALDVVSAKAVIVPHKKARLSFKVPGRVEEVLVSEGEAVKAGQELARLEIQDFDQAVLQAQASLRSAQAQLAKIKAGARAQEIADAAAAVAFAQAGAQAQQAAVLMAQGDWGAAQANLTSAGGGVGVARSGLTTAQARLNSAQANLDRLLAGASAVEIQIAEAEVERARNEQQALEQQRDATYNLLEGQLAAARSGAQIAELRLAELKAGARAEDSAAARAGVALAAGGIQTAHGQVAQAEALQAEAQVAVQVAEAQLAQTEAQFEGAQFQIAQAQALLDLVKAGSRVEDIAMAEAAVAQAETALAEAVNAQEDAVLRAPFDGTVGGILLREGETALPQAPAILIGDLTLLRVETEDLSEVDVNQVHVGQPAQITVNALDSQTFAGKVLRVAPVSSDNRGEKVYVVTVDLEARPDAGLRWGMSAFAEISVR